MFVFTSNANQKDESNVRCSPVETFIYRGRCKAPRWPFSRRFHHHYARIFCEPCGESVWVFLSTKRLTSSGLYCITSPRKRSEMFSTVTPICFTQSKPSHKDRLIHWSLIMYQAQGYTFVFTESLNFRPRRHNLISLESMLLFTECNFLESGSGFVQNPSDGTVAVWSSWLFPLECFKYETSLFFAKTTTCLYSVMLAVAAVTLKISENNSLCVNFCEKPELNMFL